MALSTELEAMLTELEKVDPAGAKEQRAVLERFPNLQKPVQEATLRQSDYDRRMNEVKPKLEKAEEWQRWATDNMPKHTQLQKDYAALEAKNAELTAEVEKKSLAAAAAAGGTGMDADKIAAAVKEQLGGIIPTAATLSKMISEATDERMRAARKDFYDTEIPRNLAFVTAMTTAQNRYLRETGKDLDTKEFSKFMVDNGISDPDKAFERFMEPINREKDVETRAKKIADDQIAEYRKVSGASGIPGSTGAQGLGHLQVRMQDPKKNDALFSQDVELGDNQAAMAAAAELRSEGKAA